MMNAPRGQEHVVKKSKFTEEQIAFALKQAELGTRVEEVCRKMGISEATFYVWRKRYGGVGPSELHLLLQLRAVVPAPSDCLRCHRVQHLLSRP